ncbi:PQQ-binding-like beta-propeller repeat protein [Streptomyces sp. M41]|uniref:serine/threonine-protein kinase n=1 Tax=Streptomyces sp. M41 TaxID=3059412 RepID=UPI00374DBCE7
MSMQNHLGAVGDYVIERRLGMGGMGTVYLGRSPSGRQVAVKVIHQQFSGDSAFVARFRQEVAAARLVSGAYTAPVIDADPDAVPPWMATQYVDAETLAQHVKGRGPLHGPELLSLAVGLAEAVRDIHRAGVVHRDLKPANVLMGRDGPLVIDFGIARPMDGAELLTQTGRTVGTPPFMAPEQFVAPRAVEPAADMFSLGSVLHFAATGRGPFDADSPYMVGHKVVHEEPDLKALPAGLREIVGSCLDKRPERRPTATRLLAWLRSVASSQSSVLEVASSQSSVLDYVPTPRARTPNLSSPSPKQPSVSRLRRAVRACVAAVVVTTVVGTAMSITTSGERDGAQASVSRLLPGWEPWRNALKGPRGAGSPTCEFVEQDVYCSGDEIQATRLAITDGTVKWTRPAVSSGGSPSTVLGGSASGLLLTVRYEEAPNPPPSFDHGVPKGARIEALDQETGNVRWATDVAYEKEGYFFGGPYVLDVNEGREVRALAVDTGRTLWKRELEEHSCRFTGSRTLVYALCMGGQEKGHPYTRVTAMSPNDGRTLWTAEHNDIYGFVDYQQGNLYFAKDPWAEDQNNLDTLLILDELTRKFSRRPLQRPLRTDNTRLHGGTLYAVELSEVHAIDVATGRTRWTVDASTDGLSVPAVSGEVLYLATDSGRVVALDRLSGEELWATAPQTDSATTWGPPDPPAPPVLLKDILIVTSYGLTVSALDVNDPLAT